MAVLSAGGVTLGPFFGYDFVEFQRFCTLDSMNMIYSSTIDLSVYSPLILKSVAYV